MILGDGGPVHTEIVGCWSRRGADVNIADQDGVTPLTHARPRGYNEIAGILEAARAR